MKFSEWYDSRVSVLIGGEVSGTEGAEASLLAARIGEKGEYKHGSFGGPSSTFLDPGTWIRNVEFKGVSEDAKKVYWLEASFDNGKSWHKYEVHDKPRTEDLDPLP